jgi:transcriptional regulator with XRE-family HTH domain
MFPITPEQCKAARALKGWLQEDLSKASDVSIGSIGKFEGGDPSTRESIVNDIYHAFLKCGVLFLDDNGVKLRNDFAYIYRTANCYDEFFADVMRAVKETKCGVFILVKSPNILTRECGGSGHTNLDRLNILSEITDVRCLLADFRLPSFMVPKFEVRNVPKYAVAPSSYIVFGDKLAKIYLEAGYYNICVHQVSSLTDDYKNSFLYAWDGAGSIQPSATERRVAFAVSA